MCLTNSRT
ncbi:unnamed protein product [Linum tenue]|uniref:Uncharacterized protein n=1 Tax=Linum tenue TaxID=586396 RepID=A0AAV0M3A1_9ROSI|nr:unnamed protein product [Linum tenue]